MSVTGELSRLRVTGDISVKDPTRVCETVADVMDAEVEGEDELQQKDYEWRNEFLYTSRPRSSHRIAILT